MSRLYLIRHGKTEATRDHLYCGATDISLSGEGEEALKGLSYNIDNVRFITSGMKRTNETLQILFGNVHYTENPAFREINFGKFEMHSYEELKYDPEYQAWITGDFESNPIPEGESGIQVKGRVMAALPELLKEDTVLISHGGVIAYIMEALFPDEEKNRYQWQPKPGYGYVIENGQYDLIP